MHVVFAQPHEVENEIRKDLQLLTGFSLRWLHGQPCSQHNDFLDTARPRTHTARACPTELQIFLYGPQGKSTVAMKEVSSGHPHFNTAERGCRRADCGDFQNGTDSGDFNRRDAGSEELDTVERNRVRCGYDMTQFQSTTFFSAMHSSIASCAQLVAQLRA